MAAVNVATRPSAGRTWGSGPVGAIALTIGLVTGIAVGAFALRPATTATQAVAPAAVAPTTDQPKVGPMAGTAAAPAQDALARYTRLVASLNAAESHDYAARYRLERQLKAVLTPETIGLIYLERSRLLESLASADANIGGNMESRIAQDLRNLCGPAAVKAQLDFCN